MTTNFSDERFGEPAWILVCVVAAAEFSVLRNASVLILTGKNAVFCIVSLFIVIFRTVTPCSVNFSFVLIFVALINLRLCECMHSVTAKCTQLYMPL